MARILKKGKIAVYLDNETMAYLKLAVQQRLLFDNLPEYLYYLLKESLEKLDGDKCHLRKSEFFAIFHDDTMKFIDSPTQILIRSAVQLEQQFPPVSFNENYTQ